MIYIDLHTHHLKKDADIQILNCFTQDLPLSSPDCFYSSGIHPWHIDQVNLMECLKAIEHEILQENMLAIGECGLDKSIKADFAVQKELFIEQVRLAERYHKPLIIHCVRAYSDLIEIRKAVKPTFPWIVHGFRGNRETAFSLIRHGFYFSVGEKLLTDALKMDILKLIPSERLFLETDDSDVSIHEIYSLATRILKIDEEMLSNAIHENFKSIFVND